MPRTNRSKKAVMLRIRNEGSRIAIFVAVAVALGTLIGAFTDAMEVWLALSPAAGAGAYFIYGMFSGNAPRPRGGTGR